MGRPARNQPPVAANVRRGSLKVSFRPGPGAARVHLAVPRSVGTAVARNRIRRRVREILRVLTREQETALAGGEYRLRISAPLEHLSAAELRAMVSGLLRDLPHP